MLRLLFPPLSSPPLLLLPLPILLLLLNSNAFFPNLVAVQPGSAVTPLLLPSRCDPELGCDQVKAAPTHLMSHPVTLVAFPPFFFLSFPSLLCPSILSPFLPYFLPLLLFFLYSFFFSSVLFFPSFLFFPTYLLSFAFPDIFFSFLPSPFIYFYPSFPLILSDYFHLLCLLFFLNWLILSCCLARCVQTTLTKQKNVGIKCETHFIFVNFKMCFLIAVISLSLPPETPAECLNSAPLFRDGVGCVHTTHLAPPTCIPVC